MELKDIAETLKRIEAELHTVKRGVYGDVPNGVKGLIVTDQEQHRRIKKLEDRDKRLLWIGTGIVISAEIMHLIVDYLKTLHG